MEDEPSELSCIRMKSVWQKCVHGVASMENDLVCLHDRKWRKFVGRLAGTTSSALSPRATYSGSV